VSTDPYVERLRRHYAPLLARHPADHRGVDWGSAEGQRRRFEVLAEVASFEGASVLDVGCGLGHFSDFLRDRRVSAHYRGIDLLPEMVEAARLRAPAGRFERARLEDQPSESTDFVLASGVFTFADEAALRRDVAEMMRVARRAVAFNSLSAWASQAVPGEFHADPAATLAWCRTLTPWVVLRHDYHPGDFTVYLYRARPA
jgi:SAM-dependent methyltransferase